MRLASEAISCCTFTKTNPRLSSGIRSDTPWNTGSLSIEAAPVSVAITARIALSSLAITATPSTIAIAGWSDEAGTATSIPSMVVVV